MNQDLLYRVVLVILASPFLLVDWCVRSIGRWSYWKVAYSSSIICSNCGESISLVGLWACSCKYTYSGHLLRTCPVCSSFPRMVRCFECGITEKLPEP